MTRYLLFATAAALILAAGVVGLLPSRYTVERSIVVAADADDIVPLVAAFPRRQAWIPWTETDPDAVYRYTGDPGAVGSTMSWTGDKIGAATLTLDAVGPDRVVTTLAMTAPMASTSRDSFTFTRVEGGTRVTWTNEAEHLPLGPARVFAVVADRVLGADYESGLRRLRDHIEQRTASN
jgi:hypothetical protein